MLNQSETLPAAPSSAVPPKLRRRDYILLPLLSVATVIVMFAVAEIGARALWPAHDDRHCFTKDAFGDLRFKRNCTAKVKIAEGPWVSYYFNACGYRTDAPCGPKPSGTFRIVLLGSSFAEGLNVPYEQTFAARTSQALALDTGRFVEVENLAVEGLSPLQCYRRLNEALALQPDLVVYAVSAFDLLKRINPVQLAQRNDPAAAIPAANLPMVKPPLLQRVMNDSRAVLVEHLWLDSDPDTYVRLFLAHGDAADYLRTPVTPMWQTRFSDFNLILSDMASRFRGAGVPFLVMVMPSLPEAALLNADPRPPHTDPFVFGRTIQAIAMKAGVGYVDAVDEFSRVPHCERLYYSVDSHPTGEGHAIIARALVRKCLDGNIPAFQGTRTR